MVIPGAGAGPLSYLREKNSIPALWSKRWAAA